MVFNKSQYKIFKEITENNSNYLFISGSAGTGKSVLIKSLLKYYGTKIKAVAMSSAAARNINGNTIHSVFRLNFNGENVGTPSLEHIDILVIDEISMVSEEIFTAIDKIMRHYYGNYLPFGGKRIICIGDLYQVEHTMTPVFRAPVWNIFKYRELTQSMRQHEKSFVYNLNLLRKSNCESIKYFNNFVQPISIEKKKEAISLVATKWQARIHNENMFHMIQKNKLIFIYAINIVETRLHKSYVKNLYSDCYINNFFNYEIKLCIDTKIMFTVNDINKKYSTGDIGIVVELTHKYIVVKLKEELVEVHPITLSFKKNNFENVKVTVTGFPVTYAWSCTVQKMQGVTLDSLIIENPNIFSIGQLYIALSRVRKSSGIVIGQEISPKLFHNNTAVIKEYKRLKNILE